MTIDFLTVLITVIAMVLMMIPGFIFNRLKLLPENSAETCSNIVMYLCQSAMVLDVFLTKSYSDEIGKNMILAIVLALFVHLFMFALVSVAFRRKDDKTRVMKYASFFSNCGFMGIPFLKMLFSGHSGENEVMIFTAMVITVFNVLNWTIGAFIISGDKKSISVKKIVLNPVLISIAVGFILFIVFKKPMADLFQDKTVLDNVTEKVMTVIKAFADMVTPLSMFVIGMKLANVKGRELFLNKKAYIVALFKLIIMPLVAILTVVFLPISVVLKYTIFLCLAMPTATSSTLFSVMFKKDSNFASVCVLLTTILSIITIPLMFLLMNAGFGVII